VRQQFAPRDLQAEWSEHESVVHRHHPRGH
jgi:hypothetical protein